MEIGKSCQCESDFNNVEVKLNNTRVEEKATSLKCSRCQYNFSFDPAGHISETQRAHHFRPNNPRKVVCYDCQRKVNEIGEKTKARVMECCKCRNAFPFEPAGHITLDQRNFHPRTI